MQKKIFYISLGGILFFLIAAGVGGYYYYETRYLPVKINELTAMSIQNSQPARNAYNSGDFTTSINSLQPLIVSAPTIAEKGRLQLLLASDLIARKQNGDVEQGATILQQVIDNFAVPPAVRAVALNTLASIVLSEDISFYTKNITSAPLNSYLPSTGTDQEKVGVAYSKILQLSDETLPTSSAEYALANYYALSIQSGIIPETNLQNTAKIIQEYVKEGDSRNDDSLYSPSTILFGQLYRAVALSVSAPILGNGTLADTEKAFQLPLDTTAPAYQKSGVNMSNPVIVAALLRTRFYYADFLMQNFNGTRNSDIQTLLQPFGQVTSPNPALGTLDNLENTTDTNYIKIEALKLANISPDFKKFLISMGVQLP